MTPEEYKRLVFKRKPKAIKEYGVNPVEITQQIKPMSVNEAWQGKRFKTDKYKMYEMAVGYSLPKAKLPAPPYSIYFEFGVSNELSDWDNPIKPLQDILQKKYEFNDKEIMEARVRKIKVEKGKEYFKVKIDQLR